MLLELRDVYVHYEKAVAVQGVSIKVNEGDLVAILGANGAGKTSVLRAISGLKQISQGEILFQGEKINGMKAAHISRLGIAHCPQGRNLFPYMTVYENLYLGAYHIRNKMKIKESLEDVQRMFPVLKQRARQTFCLYRVQQLLRDWHLPWLTNLARSNVCVCIVYSRTLSLVENCLIMT